MSLPCCLLAAFIATNVGGVGYRIYKNEYHNLYDPAVAAIRNSLPPGGLVMGGSELGFALGFGPRWSMTGTWAFSLAGYPKSSS